MKKVHIKESIYSENLKFHHSYIYKLQCSKSWSKPKLSYTLKLENPQILIIGLQLIIIIKN